jgi:anti-sigma regulatory factor (Ser/Thr protein kinase)
MREVSQPGCDVRLTVPARPENVATVRHVVTALAQRTGMPPSLVDDVRLAVTEACTNVVRHAYRGSEGPIEVAVDSSGGRLTLVVSDRGVGMSPNPDGGGPGLGLTMIAALADSLSIEQSPDRGSRLRMCFLAGAASRATEAA